MACVGGALESSVLGAAPSRCVAELLQVGHAVEVNEGARHHQDVKQLVGVELTERERETNGNKSVRDRTWLLGSLWSLCVFFAHPDVTLAREEPLGDASGVQTGSSDVEGGHEQQPAHLSHSGGFDQPLADDKVKSGHHAAQTQTHKHS